MTEGQGWRDLRSRSRDRARGFKRLAVLVALTALVAVFVYALTAPFRHPNTHLIFAVGGGDARRSIESAPFSLEQYAHLTPLKAALYQGDASAPLPLVSPAEIDQSLLSSGSSATVVDSGDTVIVVLAAHEVRGESGPALRPSGSDDPSRDLSFDEVMRKVSGLPGRAKLLVLDTTPSLLAADGLLLPDVMTREVEAAVRRTQDPTLWVLTSRSLLEQTHHSPALRRTVFGYFAGRGLKGDADLNGDRVISVGELLIYVRTGVARWSGRVTDGFAVQTPRLLWGGGVPKLADAAVPIISVMPLSDDARELDVQQGISETKTDREHGKWEKVFRERAANRMLPITNPIRDQLIQARVPEAISAADGVRDASGRNTTETDSADKEAEQSGATQSDTAEAAENPSDPGSSSGGSPNAASPPDGSEPAVGGGGDFVMPVNPLEQPALQERLAEAWLIHDSLMESRDGLPRPIDYAPDLWWAYQRQLLSVDATMRGGWSFETKPLIRFFDEQLLPMKRLLRPRDPTLETSSGNRGGSGRSGAGRSGAAATSESWVDAFQTRRPALASADRLHSVAILDANDGLRLRFDSDAVTALNRFGDLVIGEDSEALREWFDNSWRPEFSELTEFRLAGQAAVIEAADWPLFHRLCRAGWLGEQAAVAVASREVLQPLILDADRLRRDGERFFTDRVRPDWPQLATARSEEAESIYSRALAAAAAIVKIERLVHDLLAAFPYHVALQIRGQRHPELPFATAADLDELLSRVANARDLVGRPQVSVGQLLATADGLEQLLLRLRPFARPEQVSRLVDGTVRPADAWFIRLALQTPLVPVRERMQLIAALPEVEAVSLRNETFSNVAAAAKEAVLGLTSIDGLEDAGRLTRTATMRQRSNDWVRWQSGILTLADYYGRSVTPFVPDTSLTRLTAWPTDSISADTFPLAYQQLRGRVMADRQQWPIRLETVFDESADLRDRQSRPIRIDRLHQIRLWSRLIGSPIGAPYNPRAVNDRLSSAQRYDQLAWLTTRQQLALDDTPASDREPLYRAIRDYQALAQTEPLQPSLNPVATPAIEVRGPATIGFGPDQTTASAEATVINRGGEAVDVWIAVGSDRRFLDVESADGAQILVEHDLQDELRALADQAETERLRLIRAEAGTGSKGSESGEASERGKGGEGSDRATQLKRAATYPYRPDLAGLPATLRLEPGDSRRLSFTLTRTDRLSRQTKVIWRGLTAGDAVRFETEVRLPDRSAVELAIDGQSGSWSDDNQGLRMLPYPNRPTPYRLSIKNIRGRDLAATVTVFTPQRTLTQAPPDSALPTSIADAWLDRAGPLTQVAGPREVTLAADQSPVTLLPPPKKSPDESSGEPSDEPPNAAEPSATEAGPENGAGDAGSQEPPGIDVTHGLLVVVREEQAEVTSIHVVDVAPQRPRRYVDVSAGYDAALGRMTVRAEPLDGVTLPAAGIPIAVRLSDDAANPLELSLAGRLTVSQSRVGLTANLASDPGRTVIAEVDIDGFPRAFLYRFRPGSSQPRIDEWVMRNRIRIDSPAAGTAFASPLESVDVTARVDAPVGSFLDPRDELKIGVDANRDRVFRDEFPLTLRTDRQVEVRLLIGEPEDPVELVANVGDFRLSVPAGPVTDSRVNLLGQLRAGGQDSWSEPVEVIFDGRPPRLLANRIVPGRQIVEGTALQVSVSVDDDGLSGVAGVKVGFAAAGTSEFAVEPPPVEAALTAGGTWFAELPTEMVKPGPQRLLIQAIDRVGNLSATDSVAIDLLSTAEMLAEQNRPKPIRGVVMHGKTAANAATVELHSTDDEPQLIAKRVTDEQGRFDFARIAPGSYRLSARGVVRNTRRAGEVEVTVPEGDRKLQPIELKIE